MIIDDASGRPVDYEGPKVTLTTGTNEKKAANEELFAGRYRLARELGTGGMGKVYLATDTILGIDVAIKMMRSVNPVKKEDVRRKELFIREARIATSLNHDNIVPVRGFDVASRRDAVTGETVEVPYLVMEYVKDGFTLAQELNRRKTLPTEETIDILRQIAEALDYAHTPRGTRTDGIIHRDVKPDNIILQRIDGKLLARLLDFGISKPQVKGNGVKVTLSDNGGTRAYMAPERLVKTCLPTVAEDVYSFAATAYECLVGKPPVSDEGKDSEIYASIAKSWREGTLVQPLPESPFAKAVMRGLALNPEERPKTCMEFFKGVLRHDEGAASHDAPGKDGRFPGFTFALEGTEFEWNNAKQEPKVVITPPGKLVEGRDFAVRYEDNKDVGTANVAVVGLTRKWRGCWEDLPFKIVPRSISHVAIDDIAPLAYSGKPVIPKVRLNDKDLGQVLEFDRDYRVKLLNGGEAGESTIQIIGMGNYAGEAKKTFQVMRRSIVGADVTLLDHPEYTGQPARPGVAVRDAELGRNLQMGRDYSVEYGDDVEKEGWLRVVGAGNYEGAVVVPFKIRPRDINHATITAPQDVRFEGKPVASIPLKVVDAEFGCELESGVDFRVEFKNANTPGDAVVCVKGFGRYCGEVTRGFRVSKGVFDVAADQLSQRSEYDGRPHGLNVVVRNAPSATTVSYASAKDGPYARDPVMVRDVCGETPIWFRVERDGYETYSGVGTVEIRPRALDRLEIRPVEDQPFVGRAVCPKVAVLDPELKSELIRGRDFELRENGNGDAGKSCVTLVGMGNYRGERDCRFTILPKSMSSVEVSAMPEQVYDGKPKEPEVSVRDAELGRDLRRGRDYRLEYGGEREIGTGTIRIIGQGNYRGEKPVSFQIVPRGMSKLEVMPIPPIRYEGRPIEDVDVELRDVGLGCALKRGKDYEVSIEHAGRPGMASAEIVGLGAYRGGTLSVPFEILEGAFNMPKVSGFSGEYDGQSHGIAVIPGDAPPVTRILYSLDSEEGPCVQRRYVEEAPVFCEVCKETAVRFCMTCEGYKTFYGKATVEVRPRQLTRETIDVAIEPPMARDASSACPVVKLADKSLGRDLVQDVDYTLENRNAEREGLGCVVIKGRGNYAGRLVEEFAFRKPRDISAEAVFFRWPQGTDAVSAVVKDSESGKFLKQGADFRLEVWDDRPEPGWMTAKVTGCGDYDGEIIGRHMKVDRRFETLLACFADIPISLQNAGEPSAYLVKLKADVKGRAIELTDLLGCVTVDLNGFCIDTGKRSPFRLVHDEGEMQRLGFSGDFPKVGAQPSEWGDCATNLKIVNSRPGGNSGVYSRCKELVSVGRGVSWMTAFAVDDGVATGRKAP